jgi:hypothetical protein
MRLYDFLFSGIDLTPYTRLAQWFERVRAQPGYLPIDQVPTEVR